MNKMEVRTAKNVLTGKCNFNVNKALSKLRANRTIQKVRILSDRCLLFFPINRKTKISELNNPIAKTISIDSRK